MKVVYRLLLTSRRIVVDDAVNTYQKGDLYCIYRANGVVKKIPIIHIFDIDEEYVGGTISTGDGGDHHELSEEISKNSNCVEARGNQTF